MALKAPVAFRVDTAHTHTLKKKKSVYKSLTLQRVYEIFLFDLYDQVRGHVEVSVICKGMGWIFIKHNFSHKMLHRNLHKNMF